MTVVDTLPSGLTFASAAGDGWTCTSQSPSVTCTHPVGLAPSTPSILTIRVNVASTASGTLTNSATISGGGDPTPANASDTVTIEIPPPATKPSLSISKTHTPTTFIPGGEGAYTLTIANQGSGPTTEPINVTDSVPAGLTPVSASGNGWSCVIQRQVVTCGYTAALAHAPPSNTTTLTI